MPIVCVNIYVVGLNQLYDVEIDKVSIINWTFNQVVVIHVFICLSVHVSKVNKPNLPIASGEYSMEMGKAIVSAFGLMVSTTMSINSKLKLHFIRSISNYDIFSRKGSAKYNASLTSLFICYEIPNIFSGF